MDLFEKLAAGLNRAAPASAMGIAIAVTLLLFLPDPLIVSLGIYEFRNEHRGAFGWTFLLSWSYLIATIIWKTKKILGGEILKAIATYKHQSKLKELTAAEKGLLAHYMKGKNTLYLAPEDGVIGGLHGKEIVYRSSQIVDFSEGIPYNIQPWARKYLMKNPSLLHGAIKYSVFESK